VFVLEPVRSTVDYGQINAVILLACVFDALWPAWGRRGVLIGLAAAVKLTPFALVLFFAVRRDLRAVYRTAGAFVAGTALAWLVLPGPSHEFWTRFVWDPERTGKLTYPGNLSWDAVLVRTGLTHGPEHLAWAGCAVVTVVVGCIAASRCVGAGSDVGALFVVAVTGLLVSPVSWSHHWIWMVVAVPLLLSRRALGARTQVALGVLLGLVVLAPYWWFPTGWVAATAEAVTPIWAFVLLGVACLDPPPRSRTSADSAPAAASTA